MSSSPAPDRDRRTHQYRRISLVLLDGGLLVLRQKSRFSRCNQRQALGQFTAPRSLYSRVRRSPRPSNPSDIVDEDITSPSAFTPRPHVPSISGHTPLLRRSPGKLSRPKITMLRVCRQTKLHGQSLIFFSMSFARSSKQQSVSEILPVRCRMMSWLPGLHLMTSSVSYGGCCSVLVLKEGLYNPGFVVRGCSRRSGLVQNDAAEVQAPYC